MENLNKLLTPCTRKIPETLLQQNANINIAEKIKLSMVFIYLGLYLPCNKGGSIFLFQKSYELLY